MHCNIREPYVLKAMGQACSQAADSKGYLDDSARNGIADRIIASVSAGETSVDKLVALALVDLDHHR